jgi:hypothetical protein
MISHILSLGFFGLMVYAIGFQPVLGATRDDAEIQKIKRSVHKISARDTPKVSVKMKSGAKVEGIISQVLEDSFDVIDAKTKQAVTVPYADVSSVKRPGWSTGAKIALGIGIGVAVTAAIVGGVVAKKGLGGFCPLGCSTMLRP